MTNIKEVIHLYLGCEAAIGYNPCEISAMRIDIIDAVSLKGIFTSNGDFEKFDNVKPILRRLDSMTGCEAIKLCSLYSPEAFGDYRFSKWVAMKDEANFCYDVTNKNSDMSFSVDLEKMHIKVYEGGNDIYPGIENHTYFTEYLKMGFDVFGLIPSGQAIDKNLKP